MQNGISMIQYKTKYKIKKKNTHNCSNGLTNKELLNNKILKWSLIYYYNPETVLYQPYYYRQCQEVKFQNDAANY